MSRRSRRKKTFEQSSGEKHLPAPLQRKSLLERLLSKAPKASPAHANGTNSSNNWIAIFTAVLTVATLLQTYTIVHSSTAEISLTELAWQTSKPTPNVPIRYVVVFQNSGGVAGKVKNFYLTPFLGELSEVPKYGSAGVTALDVVPAKGTLRTLGQPIKDGQSVVFSEVQVEKIMNGQTKSFVYGQFEYDDVFSFVLGTRKVGFCYEYLPQFQEQDSRNSFLSCIEKNYSYSD